MTLITAMTLGSRRQDRWGQVRHATGKERKSQASASGENIFTSDFVN